MVVVVVYLVLGAVALVAFDLATKRIRSRMSLSSSETQQRLLNSGSFIGNKTAMALTLFATWIFWPVLFYGYIESEIKKETK